MTGSDEQTLKLISEIVDKSSGVIAPDSLIEASKCLYTVQCVVTEIDVTGLN